MARRPAWSAVCCSCLPISRRCRCNQYSVRFAVSVLLVCFARRGIVTAAVGSALWARADPSLRIWSRLQSSSSGRLLAQHPPVRVCDDFVGAAAADELLRSAKFDTVSDRRRRECADLPQGPAASFLRKRVAQAFGVDECFLEPLRLVKYSRRGDTFERHVDWICDEYDPQIQQLGQRIASGLIYLNDVPRGAGGETDFPQLGLRVVPQSGTALLWPNVNAEGQPLDEVDHEACPLTKDNVWKAAVNVWVRDRPLPTDPAVLSSLLLS